MSAEPSTDFGRMPRVEAMIQAVGSLAGRRIVDIGCGEGQIARMLAAAGATVQGYDPFIKPSDWVEVGPGRYRLSNGTADAIPEPAGSADIVLFFLSLHHVPQAMMAKALAEGGRLLKPDGVLCVIEPLAEGPGQYLSELYHDETMVRRNAQAALVAHALPAFDAGRVIYFSEEVVLTGWDDFYAKARANMRYNPYTEADLANPELKRRYDEVTGSQGSSFDRGYRMDLFGAVSSSAARSLATA